MKLPSEIPARAVTTFGKGSPGASVTFSEDTGVVSAPDAFADIDEDDEVTPRILSLDGFRACLFVFKVEAEDELTPEAFTLAGWEFILSDGIAV